jgi:hypothetical protein
MMRKPIGVFPTTALIEMRMRSAPVATEAVKQQQCRSTKFSLLDV